MSLLREKHGGVALGVPRGLTGLNTWVRDLLFPGEFSHVENVSTWLACGKGKTELKIIPLHMYLKNSWNKKGC
jgi:hypothetical protein